VFCEKSFLAAGRERKSVWEKMTGDFFLKTACPLGNYKTQESDIVLGWKKIGLQISPQITVRVLFCQKNNTPNRKPT
jgi:hypothetical protein